MDPIAGSVSGSVSAVVLSVFLMAVGVTHFAAPGYFRSLVPSWLDRAGPLVAASGAAEIVVGLLVLVPRSRAAGAWAAAGLITVYLVSHLDALRQARRGHPRVLLRPCGVAARLVVNLGYIGWAVAVAEAAPGAS
ncbi:MauE/DoxX family redox-associated membrane protein [Streptomyces sp. LZ34]